MFINFITLVILVGLICAIGLFLLGKIYSRFILNNNENKNIKRKYNQKFKRLKPINSLIKKEFLTILRSPEYSFQSFATCFAMPFLTFITISLISSLVHSILYINLNFEFCVFILMFYTVLINNYSQTNNLYIVLLVLLFPFLRLLYILLLNIHCLILMNNIFY